MNYQRNFIAFTFLLLMTNNILGQDSKKNVNHVILGSVHLTNYYNYNASTPHEFITGVAIEYRKSIDSLSNNFHLTFGISIESVPVKIVGENDNHYTLTHFNFTNSLGLYYSFSKSYYLGLFTSIDIPFAHRENSSFSGSTYQNFEFDFQYLNINFSAGLNFGKVLYSKDHQFIVELHFKALGLLGIKSNDYWHYPDYGIPYYGGIKLGYGF